MRAGRSHILELLRSLGPIAEQIDRQRRQDGLLGEVRALLPVGERSHCLGASGHDGLLVLTVESAAWATRLHYRLPILLSALGPLGITAIKMRIQPPGQGLVGRRLGGLARDPGGAGISAAVADHLLAAADAIDDPGIAEALRRLARRRRASSV
jgi:hypothetical protein